MKKAPNITSKIKAAILAGGKAQRMNGIAKGNLLIREDGCYNISDYQKGKNTENTGSITIMQRLLGEITHAGINETIIVANDPLVYTNYGVKVIPDLWRDLGPIAGVVTALDYYYFLSPDTDALLITPCDLPNFSAHEIMRLISAYYRASSPTIVYAATAYDEPHPLCAIINTNLLLQLRDATMRGERKIMMIWQQFAAKTVFFDAAADKIKFSNVNNFYDQL